MVSFLFSFHLQKSVWSWSLVTYFNILVYRLRTIHFSTNDRLRTINFSTSYRLRTIIFSTNSHVPHNVNWNWPLVQYEMQEQTTCTCMLCCCFISFNLDHLHIVWTSICLFKFFKWSYFEDKDLSGELFRTCCMLLEKTSIHCGLRKLQFTDLNDYLSYEQFGAVELGCNHVTRSCLSSEWFDRSEQLVNCWHVKAHIALPVTQ